MTTIIDCHTHHPDAARALIAVSPREFDPQPGLWYSVGYHPWHDVDTLGQQEFALLEQCARHPQVLAIGETGMDRLRGASQQIQGQVFVRHLQLAHSLNKPVVAHCVRTAQELIALRRHAGLTDVALIIHGMRGNEHVAHMLLEAGCYLSYGTFFNPAALAATPLDRLLIETDDGDEPIHVVAARIATSLKMDIQQLIETVTRNFPQ